MGDTEDKDRAKRLAGRFADEETEDKSSGPSEAKVMSMKIPKPLYDQVQKKFEEIFVAYVKETETTDLKKGDFYKALISTGIDNLELEDLKDE